MFESFAALSLARNAAPGRCRNASQGHRLSPIIHNSFVRCKKETAPNRSSLPNHPVTIAVSKYGFARRCSVEFVSAARPFLLAFPYLSNGRCLVDIAYKLNVLAAGVAFAFVGAILLRMI